MVLVMAHRIDFSQFDVIVMQIGSPGVPPQVLITWTVETIRGAAHDVEFSVERSQTPDFTDTDAIEVVSPAIPAVVGQTVYEYLDITLNLQNFWRRWYYRISAADAESGKTTVTDIKTWESDPKIFELEIIARHDWLLRYETGTPCFAFVERTSGGDHCQACYNESLGRSTISQCHVCFGTGRERPFYKPILSFIDFNPPEKLTSLQQMEVQMGQANVWWSAFPQLKPRDIFVEVLSGKRWRIVKVVPIGDVRTSIQHFATIDEIKPRDIEYRIAIPTDVQRAAVNDLEDMKNERRF